MSAPTLEERLAIVETELAQLKSHIGISTHKDGMKTFPKTPGALDAALEQIWQDTPDEVWERFPEDFGGNLDHYLYGTPKK
jgi:hypothetical protein